MADANKWSIENLEVFQSALKKAQAASADMRIPLTLIAKDFYKSEKSIFKVTKGPGQYTDLSALYKKQKAKRPPKGAGFVYPILKYSGALERSVTDPTDSNAINYILNQSVLIIGTRVPYAKNHQFGIGVPMRPFLFIGPEAPRYATDQTKGRLERWLSILQTHVEQNLKGVTS